VKVKTHKKDFVEIRVEPWEVHVAPGDTVAWILSANITDIQINLAKNRRRGLPAWAGKYLSEWSLKSSKPTATRSAFKGRDPVRKHYGISLAFEDPNGGPDRTATIDPDMVMDT